MIQPVVCTCGMVPLQYCVVHGACTGTTSGQSMTGLMGQADNDLKATSGIYTGYMQPVEKWRFCPSDGKKLETDWLFCPLCGKGIGTLQLAYNGFQASQQAQQLNSAAGAQQLNSAGSAQQLNSAGCANTASVNEIEWNAYAVRPGEGLD
jgi:hypothetical protein